MRKLQLLAAEVTECTLCPRLVAHREEVSATKRRAYREEVYWGKPVSGFGDPTAKLVILGLAPGAHGANRTGRVFTGDRSGDFLYAALHRAGFANQPTSEHKDDGLELHRVWITLAARCVPPDNHPSLEEVRRCGTTFLDRELLMLKPTVILALGSIAWDAAIDHLGRRGAAIPKPRPAFAHAARMEFLTGHELGQSRRTTSRQKLTLLASYHVSQQNTQTGRLTPAMLDSTLRHAATILLRGEGP